MGFLWATMLSVHRSPSIIPLSYLLHSLPSFFLFRIQNLRYIFGYSPFPPPFFSSFYLRVRRLPPRNLYHTSWTSGQARLCCTIIDEKLAKQKTKRITVSIHDTCTPMCTHTFTCVHTPTLAFNARIFHSTANDRSHGQDRGNPDMIIRCIYLIISSFSPDLPPPPPPRSPASPLPF